MVCKPFNFFSTRHEACANYFMSCPRGTKTEAEHLDVLTKLMDGAINWNEGIILRGFPEYLRPQVKKLVRNRGVKIAAAVRDHLFVLKDPSIVKGKKSCLSNLQIKSIF